MLFMMFINDIIQCVNDDLEGVFTVEDIRLFLHLYADDQVIFVKSPEALQAMLLYIEHY